MRQHQEFIQQLRQSGHQPIWVTPQMRSDLIRHYGGSGHVMAHPQFAPPGTPVSPFDEPTPIPTASPRPTPPPMVPEFRANPTLREDAPNLSIDAGRIGSLFFGPGGGFTPQGPGYTGTPAVEPTTWRRDPSAPGGYVPHALPTGDAGFHPIPFGGGFGVDGGTAANTASLSKNTI